MRFLPCLVVAVLWTSQGLAAEAAVDDPEPAEEKAKLTPPELISKVEASYPSAALEARVEGRVILLLTISSGGKVTKAEVLEGLGYGLDEAAVLSAQQFVFSPATRGDVKVGARIRYAYEFELPEAASSTADDATPSGNDPTQEPGASADTTLAVIRPIPAVSQLGPVSGEPESTENVVVHGLRAEARQLRSTAAVTVVDLSRAKRESADLAEVLARVEGVNVQRMGGLGSPARFSLAGFDDTRVRFFIDGIPLEFQGFSMGLQNVPLGFADRIDVYKGVVPIQFGADSLGGAFNLVTDRRTAGTRAFASYQAGSFDTHRLIGALRHLDEKTGLFVKTEGFFDASENNYPIDVQVGTTTGDLVDATVRRYHDRYRAGTVNLEAGFVNRKWAERLLLKGFVSSYDKDLPHNALMTRPYGEAVYGGVSSGFNLRYQHNFGQGLSGSFVTGYVYDQTDFLDNPTCIYDWYGNCTLETQGRRGEVGGAPKDQTVWDHTGFGRFNLDWKLSPEHSLAFSIAPTHFARQGDNRLRPGESAFDELRAGREMFKWINGIEYKTRFFAEHLENGAFVKNYLLIAQSEEAYESPEMNSQNLYWGAGDGVRLSLNDWAMLKASYEYSVRLPEPREVFGNSVQIEANLNLTPEHSHNLNLSFLVTDAETRSGVYNGVVTGFFRDAEGLILLTGQAELFRYENAYQALIYGMEAAASWLAPGNFLELGVNATYQEYRNESDQGNFAQFKGDRIPNKPYLFGNATARLLWQQIFGTRDEVSLTWYSRYTEQFLRFWESVGFNNVQPTIPSQLVHTIVLSYLVRGRGSEELSFSAEAQNLTDENTFDFYGIQKPGRAFYAKVNFTY